MRHRSEKIWYLIFVRYHIFYFGVLDGDLKKYIEEIAAISEEAAAGVEQTSASTQQTSSAMEEVAGSSDQLARLAEELNGLVRNFKL